MISVGYYLSLWKTWFIVLTCLIATATGILSSLRHSTSCQDDEMQNGLEIIHIYLRVALISFSIGHATQSIHIDFMGLPRSCHDEYPMVESSSVPQILLKLSGLLYRCISFSRKDLTKLMPAPWARDSSYMTLKQELDVVHIIYGGNSALETETLEMLQKQETGAGYYVLCMSMLHAMRMLLDAVFLPIPVIPAAGYAMIDRSAATKAFNRKMIYFPAAPRSFWCERTASCMRSARSVTSLCESLMDHFDFAMVCSASSRPFRFTSRFIYPILLTGCEAAISRLHTLLGWIDLLKSIAHRDRQAPLGRLRRTLEDHLFLLRCYAILLYAGSSLASRAFSGSWSRSHFRNQGSCG